MKRMFFSLMICMLLASGAEVKTLQKVRPSPEEINKKFDSSAQRLMNTMERLEHTADKLAKGSQ